MAAIVSYESSAATTADTPVADFGSGVSLTCSSSGSDFVEAGERLGSKYPALFGPRAEPTRRWWPIRKRKGRYEYLTILGHGSFGVAWSARLVPARLPAKLAELREGQLDQGQQDWLGELSETAADPRHLFACKVVLKASAGKAGPKPAAVGREVRTLELCRGPHVLLLVEYFETKEAHHIITQRCYGTVEKRLDGAPPSTVAQCARKWIAQLFRAVAHVHAQGVVHRDVKPANVFCTSPGPFSDVALGDFGLAKVVGNDGSAQSAGSWGYWDVPAFDGYMTRDSDLWAVGISALEMCGVQLELLASTNLFSSAQIDAKLYHRDLLREGFARHAVEEEFGILQKAGLRPFLLANLDVRTKTRPSSSALLALLPLLPPLPEVLDPSMLDVTWV